MLLMVLRKMLNNKWMVLCLLLGTVLTVAMVSSIPMFSEAVLNRMLRKDLEQYQLDSGVYPGRFLFRASIDTSYKEEDRLNALQYFDQNVFKRFAELIPIDTLVKVETVHSALFRFRWEQEPEESKGAASRLTGMSGGIFERVNVTRGRLPSRERVDGVYEVMATQAALEKLGMFVGRVYNAADVLGREGFGNLKFEVTGLFEPADLNDLYWYESTTMVDASLVMDYDLLMRDFIVRQDTLAYQVDWYVAYDYHKLAIDTLPEVVEGLQEMRRWLEKYKCGPVRIPVQTMLETYGAREAQLRTILTVLQVPILLMLAFYMLMVSQLIVDYERGEIAVLKSRGSSRAQVFAVYLMESASIGLFAIIVGPLLAMFMCHLLGASNGFLEFVSRTALQLTVNANTLVYAGAAVLFSIVMILGPAIAASAQSVVAHKQRKTQRRIAWWKKIGLDVILLGASFYGLYSYSLRQETVAETLAEAQQVPIDPLLFLISTMFILGAGLVILRVYPLIIRLVFFIGRKFWPPVLYASFLTVSRSGGQEQFLMLFLILTLSVGIFSANSARTINRNAEDRIYYQAGADIVLTADWPSNRVEGEGPSSGMGAAGGASTNPNRGFANESMVTYKEPDYREYGNIKGLTYLAKVFEQKAVTANAPGMTSAETRLMAIESADFGKVAFMPDELVPTHWYNYLNLLTHEPSAALVSSSFQKLGYRAGDSVMLTWAEQQPMEVRIYGFIDYWPSFNPNDARYNKLVVCNLSYVQAKMTLEPYNVWAKREPGVTTAEIYDSIENDCRLDIVRIVNSGQSLIRAKNDPMLQGANGAMTMGFIVTMIITTIGFIIYWTLSIKGRVLQFGILRAMGMPMAKLYAMLLCEQVMISLCAILFGIIIGGVTSQLFVPLLQMVYSAQAQVPPFRVVSSGEDYIKIYAILGFVLAVCLSVIGVIVSRIRIAQALKLGEE